MKSTYFGFIRFLLITGLVYCALHGAAQAVTFGPGWTLAGNGRDAVIDVPVVFGTKSVPVTNVTDAVTTIWKWDAISQKWAFFSPTMDLDQVATYAASKGYSVLRTIFPGEGYWVNASKSTTITDSSAPAFALSPWALTGGWNLVSTGSSVTAPQFNASIAPFTATTVWAWDSVNTNWFFYTPTLDSAQLAGYIAQKNYLDFGGQAFSHTTGFWINRAAVTGSPTAGLAPIDQAKQMFSELRTTFHAFANASSTGALNDQVRRMGTDLNGVAVPSVQDVLRRMWAFNIGADLYRAVKLGQAAGFPAYGTNGYLSAGNYHSSTNDVYGTWRNEAQASFANSFNLLSPQPGFGYISCTTNASVATAGLSSVGCGVYGPDYSTYVNSANWTRQYIGFTLTETAPDQYAYTSRRRQITSTNGVQTATIVDTAIYSGTFSQTKDSNGVPQALALAGDLPALVAGVDKTAVSLNLERNLLTAGTPNASYRYAATGSIAGIDATGRTSSSFVLSQGSYFDNLEDNLGNSVEPNSAQALNLVGVIEVRGTRFDGTMNAKDFTADADTRTYIPTDVSFTGSISDISAGGSGTILNVTLTGAVSNYAAYRSTQPSFGSNYLHGSLSLNGTVQLPSRPVMSLTLSGAATGPTTDTLSGQYTYDNGLVITIAATRDSSNSASDTMSFTNQDGIVVTLPASGNGTITKSGTTLGEISNGMISYTDGYFESLN